MKQIIKIVSWNPANKTEAKEAQIEVDRLTAQDFFILDFQQSAASTFCATLIMVKNEESAEDSGGISGNLKQRLGISQVQVGSKGSSQFIR